MVRNFTVTLATITTDVGVGTSGRGRFFYVASSMIGPETLISRNTVIPADKIAGLIASLRKVPDYSWVLTPPSSSETRLQGDLLNDFPISTIDAKGAVRSGRLTVLVLNNTCDLQPDRPTAAVTVAPVTDFNDFTNYEVSRRGYTAAQSYLHAARSNHIDELLWIPAFSTFRLGAVVYLDRLSSAAFPVYEQSLSKRVASFSQNGFYFLLMKITNHFARAESQDVTRG